MTIISTSTIVAQAFRFMEVTPPSALEDLSEKAQDATQQYPEALRQCLETYDWSFASRLANLPQADLPETSAIDIDLPYSYAVPGDLVRLQEVGDFGTAWRLDSEGLRADTEAPLRVRYTRLVQNENSLPATFRLLVSLRLAQLLGAKWLTTTSKLDRLTAQEAAALREAKRQDASNASAARYDDLTQADDWVSEAVR